MKTKTLITLFCLVLVSCSSGKKEREVTERENENIERDYLVRDASSKYRPGWIEDAEIWARDYNKDLKRYRYFSYETEPKVSRAIACNIAKANTKSDIAGEIATFINKELGSSQEGTASVNENKPEVAALQSYVQNTLTEKIQALIHGAAIVKTYWEKRKYQKEKGAVKDYTAWTCAVFVRINSKVLRRAIDQAAQMVIKEVDTPSVKDNVKRALNDAPEKFIQEKLNS